MVKKGKDNNILIFAILGAGAGFFLADYLKQQEIKELKAKIEKNPSDFAKILSEGKSIFDVLTGLFKKRDDLDKYSDGTGWLEE